LPHPTIGRRDPRSVVCLPSGNLVYPVLWPTFASPSLFLRPGGYANSEIRDGDMHPP
jgi:hypothetical protein